MTGIYLEVQNPDIRGFEMSSTDRMTDKQVFQYSVQMFGEVSFKSVDIREYHDEQKGV